MNRRLASFCAVLFFVPTVVLAQQAAKSRYLQIEELSEEAQSCGLKRALIVATAAQELKEIGLQIVAVPTTRYVHLSTFVVAFEQSAYCTVVWNFDVKSLELLSHGKGPVEDLRPKTRLLCRAEIVTLYNRRSAQSSIAEAMRNLAAQCSRQTDL